MSDTTINQLAKVLGTSVDKLMSQLSEAGMKFESADQPISSTEKVKLLGFLRRHHGKKEATSRSTSNAKMPSASWPNRRPSARKKRTSASSWSSVAKPPPMRKRRISSVPLRKPNAKVRQ